METRRHAPATGLETGISLRITGDLQAEGAGPPAPREAISIDTGADAQPYPDRALAGAAAAAAASGAP
jgi:hypothetical protein